LEEAYDHVGEMVRRARAFPAAPQHEFEIGQGRQHLGAAERLQGIGQAIFRKDRYPEASVERGENTCRTRALKVRLTSRAALVKLPESQMATKLRKRTVS
jgi:hypothetical protein